MHTPGVTMLKDDVGREGHLLTVAQAAARLGLTEHAIRGRVAQRLIPFRKMGTRVVFIAAEVDDWLSCLPG